SIQVRVNFDNVVTSGRVVANLGLHEMEALRHIEQAHASGMIKRVTSRESWREQDQADDDVRKRLQAARAEVSVVAIDHAVLGFGDVTGPFGTSVAYPLVTDIVDEALFADLKKIGLHDGDARHLMYAA